MEIWINACSLSSYYYYYFDFNFWRLISFSRNSLSFDQTAPLEDWICFSDRRSFRNGGDVFSFLKAIRSRGFHRKRRHYIAFRAVICNAPTP